MRVVVLASQTAPGGAPPGLTVVLGSALVALLLLVALDRLVRHSVTIAHEGGHALLFQLLGANVTAVEIGRDGGSTTGHGELRWLENVLSTAAGYAAPSAFGVLAANVLAHGRADVVLWVTVVLLVLFATASANWTTAFKIGFLAFVLGYVGVRGSPDARTWAACLWTWVLLLGGVGRVLERWSGAQDFHDLRGLTLVPATVWALVYTAGTVVAAAFGALLLVGAREPFL